MRDTAPDFQKDKASKKSIFHQWGKYAAFGAFIFFLLKGLGWLLLLGLAVWGVTG